MAISDLKIHLAPEVVFNMGQIPVTNTIITMWIVMGILIAIALCTRFTMKYIPSGLQNFIEWALGGMYDFMEEVGGRATKAHFPFFITFFLTILFSNWLGIALGVVA